LTILQTEKYQSATTPIPTTVYTTDPPTTTPAWPGQAVETIFMTGFPIEMNNNLLAFEFFALGNGTIDLLVLRPGCTTNTYCTASESCASTSTCAGSDVDLVGPCTGTVTDSICSLEKICSGSTSMTVIITDAASSLLNVYELFEYITVSISNVLWHHKLGITLYKDSL
jgi:hypothetical protein